jgi:hypothetical protein
MLSILKNSDALGSREAPDNSEAGAVSLRRLIEQAQGERTPDREDELGLDESALLAVQRIASERFQMSGASGSPRDSPRALAPFIFNAFTPSTHASGIAGSFTNAPIVPFGSMSADVPLFRFGAAGTSQTTDLMGHQSTPLVDFATWSNGPRLAAHLLSKGREGAPELWQDMFHHIMQDPGLDMDPDLLMELYMSAQDGSGDMNALDGSENDGSDDDAMLDAQCLLDTASATKLGVFFLQYVRKVLRRAKHGQDRLGWTFFQLNVDSALTSLWLLCASLHRFR